MLTEIDIKKQLMKCYEQKLPVLLCGDSSINYVDLVFEIHRINSDVEDGWEYFGSDETLKSVESMVNGVRKAIKERDYTRMDEILGNCKSTTSTIACVDWSTYDRNSSINKLVDREGYNDRNHMLSHLSIRYNTGTRGDRFLLDFEPYDNGQYWAPAFIERKGLLFIINQFYHPEEDKNMYEKITTRIKDRKDNDHKTGDWLVMHTYDPSGFPDFFKNQFVEIPLDGKVKVEKIEGFTAGTRQSSDNEFFLNGNMWTISYEGNTINLVDSKGLKYIHYLLSNPKKEFDALMLQREIDKMQPSKYKNRSEGAFFEEGMKISRIGNTKTRTSRIKKMDELDYSIKQSEMQAEDESKLINEKREKLLKELEDLEDIQEIKEEAGHLDEYVAEKKDSLTEEIARLTKILANYGKGEIADIEKARSAVKNTINNSLGKIKESHSSLWEHLDSRIKRRSSCSYTPAKHISWVLSP